MTPLQFANRLNTDFKVRLLEINRLAAAQAVTEVKSEYTERVFEKGKDSSDTLIGLYRSIRHKAARKAKGLQTKFKDYNYTGSLFASVRQVSTSNAIVLAIVDVDEVSKSRELEKQDGKAVFDLTSNEFANLSKYHQELGKKLLDNIIL